MGDVVVSGKARATRYSLSHQAFVTMPLNLDTYFAVEEDKRVIQSTFNFELIRDILPSVTLFSEDELAHLSALQDEFKQHLSQLTDNEYRQEMERLGIDLSWKSSQIGEHLFVVRNGTLIARKQNGRRQDSRRGNYAPQS